MKILALIAAACMAVVSAKNSNLRAVFKQGAKTQSVVTACGCTCTCEGHWTAPIAKGICSMAASQAGSHATAEKCHHYVVEKLGLADGGDCAAATATFDTYAKKKNSGLNVKDCTGKISAAG